MSSGIRNGDLYDRGANAPARGMILLGVLLAVLGMGWFVVLANGDDPARAWRMFHVNFLFFTGVALGATVFAATQKITKGVWSGPIIRFAEAGVAFLPIAVVCFLILFVGRNELFPWIEHPTPARGQWLTVWWVFWRDLIALIVLLVVAVALVYNDLKPDVAELRDQVSGWKRALYDRMAAGYTGLQDDRERIERRLSRLAVAFCLLYAWLFSLIAFDLVMSLAPYWISNLFGAFFFMGALLTGLTMLGLMTVYWRWRLGLRDVIGRQQFHDLGKLVFGFSVFWAYLVFSQLLVIWYGNLREETSFVFYRLWGDWQPLSIMVGLMVFLIPFWGLIWVKSKVTAFTFSLFLLISFLGVWLERYLLVQPSLTEHVPPIGLPEVGISLGFLGLFLLAYGLFARTFPMVSPRLTAQAEATGHH
jgi:hypothetical protein